MKVLILIKFLGEIFLNSIYDPDEDDAKKGICCSRIKFYKYDQVKCIGKQCQEEDKRRKIFPPTDDQLNQDPNLANYCIDIFIFQQAAMKICHRKEDFILKLKNTIIYGTLKTVPGVDPTQLMSN